MICDGCNVREPHEHRCHGARLCNCEECRLEEQMFGVNIGNSTVAMEDILSPECVSAVWVGKNQRVALWCITHDKFIGNPSDVQETNDAWTEHTGIDLCCPYDCGHCHDGCGCPDDRNPDG